MRAGLPGSHDEVTTDRGQRRGQDWAPMPPPPPHLSPPGLRALLWGGTTEGARESAPQEKGEGVPERDPSHGRAEDQGLRPQASGQNQAGGRQIFAPGYAQGKKKGPRHLRCQRVACHVDEVQSRALLNLI